MNCGAGAGTGTDESKSNPCARLFQLPAGKCRWTHQLNSAVFVPVKGPIDT